MAVATYGLLAAFMAPSAHADTAPLTEPHQAAALAAKLGDDRTGGIYLKDGRPVVAVTDQATGASVREAGGTAQVVAHSTAELNSIHAELDRLGGIPNTAWGVDPSTNQVSVEIYDGVSDADQARIAKVAGSHRDAVRIEKISGKPEKTAYDMRGGIGISSGGRHCSAGFNVQNDAGKKFLISAGHCMVGGYYDWYRRSGGIYLGTQISFDYGGGDYAVIEYRNSDVTPYGTIQYKDGTSGQITTSRYAYDGESVKRVGGFSQDLVGMVLEPSMTITYDDGETLHNMIKTSNCDVFGDSGGSLFTGSTALGITSGGNYADQPCGDSDDQADRATWYHPVQSVLSKHSLQVY
ncbi:S1 family peptidase [Streptomyces cavernicola]|uniref:S1 family peptidase n=1 Tax=Streptomyces cavernicola TaxID=3043613 RepID=A0ABT6SKC0_9ACTN|nr:S1 family peptidase [Streptomyces sp. B-S-A6]MDI3407696.1 S1 family peptidase [Streptomyces sp. B-S-A6]